MAAAAVGSLELLNRTPRKILSSEKFLPAAKPTGLVEANSSFFLLLIKEGLNSVTYVTHYDSHDSYDSL